MKLKRYFYSSVAIILNGVCMLLGTTQLLRLENKIEFHHLISCAHWSLHSISFLSQQTPKAQLCKDMTSLKGMWWPYIETMSYLKPALHTLANRSWSFLCLEKKKKKELSYPTACPCIRCGKPRVPQKTTWEAANLKPSHCKQLRMSFLDDNLTMRKREKERGVLDTNILGLPCKVTANCLLKCPSWHSALWGLSLGSQVFFAVGHVE